MGFRLIGVLLCSLLLPHAVANNPLCARVELWTQLARQGITPHGHALVASPELAEALRQDLGNVNLFLYTMTAFDEAKERDTRPPWSPWVPPPDLEAVYRRSLRAIVQQNRMADLVVMLNTQNSQSPLESPYRFPGIVRLRAARVLLAEFPNDGLLLSLFAEAHEGLTFSRDHFHLLQVAAAHPDNVAITQAVLREVMGGGLEEAELSPALRKRVQQEADRISAGRIETIRAQLRQSVNALPLDPRLESIRWATRVGTETDNIPQPILESVEQAFDLGMHHGEQSVTEFAHEAALRIWEIWLTAPPSFRQSIRLAMAVEGRVIAWEDSDVVTVLYQMATELGLHLEDLNAEVTPREFAAVMIRGGVIVDRHFQGQTWLNHGVFGHAFEILRLRKFLGENRYHALVVYLERANGAQINALIDDYANFSLNTSYAWTRLMGGYRRVDMSLFR